MRKTEKIKSKQRCGGHGTRRDSDASSWYYLYSSARGPAFRAECETLKVRVLTPVTPVALRDMGMVELWRMEGCMQVYCYRSAST